MPAALQVTDDAPKMSLRRAKRAKAGRINLTSVQKRLILNSFMRLEPALDLVSQLFFLKLFRIDSGMRKKFDGPVEMQARKFAAGAKLAMISLGHEDGLEPTLKLLGTRHRQMGIRARHYRTMSKALMWTLEHSLESAFDDETREAWDTMLTQFTKVMAGTR